METCQNCNASLKTTMFTSNEALTQKQVALINAFTDNTSAGYCTKCGKDMFDKAKHSAESELAQLNSNMNATMPYIPIITLQNPAGWNYSVIKMVTAQATTGTGVFSEVSASISDFLGNQSTSYNAKLKEGENLCAAQLRAQALNCGANAVIGTDIDYSELGSGKGMLMVCMAGTAIKLQNTDVLQDGYSEKIESLFGWNERINKVKQLLKGI